MKHSDENIPPVDTRGSQAGMFPPKCDNSTGLIYFMFLSHKLYKVTNSQLDSQIILDNANLCTLRCHFNRSSPRDRKR